MEAKSTDQKTFQLRENGQLLGELIYGSLFSQKTEIKLTNADRYDIKPMGVFSTSIAVTKNGAEIVKLTMNRRGQIVFTFQDGQEFVFKAKGAFLNKYIIENKEEEKLISLDPQFNWSKFSYNYDILYEKRPQDILFVLLGIYAANDFIASMSGSMRRGQYKHIKESVKQQPLTSAWQYSGDLPKRSISASISHTPSL
jgi:hypothetical protein